MKPSILIVDDVEANLVALDAQLSSLDCQVVRARSGEEALRQLLKRDFAVVLLDVQMPGMDGYEVAHYVRNGPGTREVPIIFLTASHETEETRLRSYGTGAVDLLFKPITPFILMSKVRVFLELYQGKKRLADEIEAHQRTLAELDAFNYSVSHDLRAPLRHLEGFSQMLLESHAEELDAQGQGYVRRIRGAAQRMSQLIDDMLQLSRISRAEPRRAQVDLSALATTVTSELRQNDPTRDVEIVVAPNLTLQGDPGLLRIALENLCGNAWKFTGKKPRARIEIGARADGAETVYFVRDDGAGFDPAFSARLFQPFARLHAADDFQGTGIGLAIVQRVVGHHGGWIRGESQPGQGATFFFTLQPKADAG